MRLQEKLIEWTLGYSDAVTEPATDCITVTVPSLVQIDMGKAKNIPSFYQGNHENEYAWMEDKFWHYTTSVSVNNGVEMPILCMNSVDYSGEIRINGKKQLVHEGMFTPIEFDLSPWKGETVELEVVLYPVPKRPGYTWERGLGNEASASCKPAFSYGWDWCPRLVTIGLCGDVYVEYRNAAVMKKVAVSYRLTEELDSVTVTAECETYEVGVLSVMVYDKNNEVVAQTSIDTFVGTNIATVVLKNPILWWPNEQGDQYVYRMKLIHEAVGCSDDWERNIGFRRVRLLPNEGTWDDQPYLQQTQSKFPMQMEINGRKIFCKGSNWVPPEMGYNQINSGNTELQIRYLKEAHMNILRIWGGGFVYGNDFYDICDKYGIMIWQEFPLSCANYSDEDSYLEVLRKESETIIRRLQIHPCLAIWCGGNELFCRWGGMTPQSSALRLLDSLCYELDPFTPFLSTSPMYGVGHGRYSMMTPVKDKSEPEEHITQVCKSHCTAYTEFGCGCPSEWEYLKTFMTDEEIHQPIHEGSVWKAHHNQWFSVDAIRMITNCENDIHIIVNEGVKIQARMYAMMFEEMRRQQPFCSMAINWCYNEPWPTASGNGLINYPCHRKPSYYAVQNALRGQKLSLQFARLSWSRREKVSCIAWVLNDSNEEIPSGVATVTLIVNGKETMLGKWGYESVPARTNREGLKLFFQLSEQEVREFSVRISGTDSRLNDIYTLYVKDFDHKTAPPYAT